MATLKDFDDGSRQKTGVNGGALVAPIHPYVDPLVGGCYRLSLRTGLLSGVAGAAALFSMRNPSTTKTVVIDRLALRLLNDTDFTAQQTIGIAAYIATAMTAQFSAGGGTLNLSIARAKKRANMSPPSSTIYFASSSTAITGATIGAEDTQPLVSVVGSSPAAGTTVQNVTHESVFVGGDEGGRSSSTRMMRSLCATCSRWGCWSCHRADRHLVARSAESEGAQLVILTAA
jgi:hypothetical protein